MTEVRFYAPDEIALDQISLVAVSIRVQQRWLFYRSDGEDLFQMCFGKRSRNEEPLEAAHRLISDAIVDSDFSLTLVCPFGILRGNMEEIGMLYFTVMDSVHAAGNREITLLDRVPDRVKEPEIFPRLFHGTQGWLNMQSNADELWDVYDCNRRATGRVHRRGDFLKRGDYHIVVHVWIMNQKNEFLLTKRAPTKGFPNMWETPGGAALCGDDSLQAAMREIREETGLLVAADEGTRLLSIRREDDFLDVWVFRHEFNLDEVILLEGETVDKRACSAAMIRWLYSQKELVPYEYLETFLETLEV